MSEAARGERGREDRAMRRCCVSKARPPAAAVPGDDDHDRSELLALKPTQLRRRALELGQRFPPQG